MVRDQIPAEWLKPTPRPTIPQVVTAAVPGVLLIQYDDALGTCNLDKKAIRDWQTLLMKEVKK